MRKTDRKKKKIIFCGVLLSFLLFMALPLMVSADITNPDGMLEEVAEILSKNKDFFVQNQFLASAFRYLEWAVVNLLYMLCDGAEKVYLAAFQLLSFGTGEEVQQFVQEIQPIYQSLVVLSIAAVGVMVSILHVKIPDVLKGIVLSVAVVTCTLFFMTRLNTALYDPSTETGLITWAMGGEGEVTDEIIRSNFYDLLYIEENIEGGIASFSQDNLEQYHYPELKEGFMSKVDILEVIDPKNEDLSEEAALILGSSLVTLPDQTYITQQIQDGVLWTDIGNEYYYRYKVNFFDCILTLFAFCIVYLSLAYNAVKIIFNMVVSRILSILYSADFTGMKKTLMILNSIKDGYIALFLTAILIRLFTMIQEFISVKFEGHPVINVILILMVSFAVLTGPSIIEKLTGYNMGASGGLGLVYGATQVIRGTSAVGRNLIHAAGAGTRAMASAEGPKESGSYAGYNPSSRSGMEWFRNVQGEKQEALPGDTGRSRDSGFPWGSSGGTPTGTPGGTPRGGPDGMAWEAPGQKQGKNSWKEFGKEKERMPWEEPSQNPGGMPWEEPGKKEGKMPEEVLGKKEGRTPQEAFGRNLGETPGEQPGKKMGEDPWMESRETTEGNPWKNPVREPDDMPEETENSGGTRFNSLENGTLSEKSGIGETVFHEEEESAHHNTDQQQVSGTGGIEKTAQKEKTKEPSFFEQGKQETEETKTFHGGADIQKDMKKLERDTMQNGSDNQSWSSKKPPVMQQEGYMNFREQMENNQPGRGLVDIKNREGYKERGTSISREESMMQKKSSFSQPSIESIHERNVPEKGYPYRGVGDIPAGISLQEPPKKEKSKDLERAIDRDINLGEKR